MQKSKRTFELQISGNLAGYVREAKKAQANCLKVVYVLKVNVIKNST